jgi:hypothetical protein
VADESPWVRERKLPDDYFEHPSPARVWNYWLRGKDNYPVDREVGKLVADMYPGILDMATESRTFLTRSVRYLAAEKGIRQFLDLGCGLPAAENTHQVAQSVLPDARVVYVDNDLIVGAHACALMTSDSDEGVAAFVEADYRDTETVLAGARDTLNFAEPISVMFMGVFGYQPDHAEMLATVRRVVDAVVPGSYLTLWDGTDTSDGIRVSHRAQAEMGHPYTLRTIPEIEECFAGLELLEPGVVQLPLWRPAPIAVDRDVTVDAYGGVALKVSQDDTHGFTLEPGSSRDS